LLALFSGAPALVYQVVWTRLAALAVGSQVEATSWVLAAFFGGLAIGARLFGNRADRTAAPLRLYGLLEIGAGLLAAASLLPLAALASGALAGLPAVLAVCASLLPATLLLGGSLPALLRAGLGSSAETARQAGWILGANTLGSVAGVALAAAGVPLLGLRAILGCAALGSLMVGLAGLLASGRRRSAAGFSPVAEVGTAGGRAQELPLAFVLAAAAAAGAVTLAFEVLAARASALRLGSSLLAWAGVLALYLGGLAAGNLALAGHAARTRRPVLSLGWIQAAVAAALVLGAGLLSFSPAAPAEGLAPRPLGLLLAAVAPVAFLSGAAFPLFVRLAVRGGGESGAFGTVSAWNTAGGIAGALLAPFVLLSRLGPAAGAGVCAALSLALAAALLARGSAGFTGAASRIGAACAAVALLAALPAPAPSQDTAGARLLFVGHGRQATAVVAQISGRRDLIVDGDPEASTAGEARLTEEMLAILPILLHPAPERFLELGLGSGITLATAARFPLAELVCVEIADSVLRAARFFAPDNSLGPAQRRVRVLPGDARVFLARTAPIFDVAVANTLHPWSVGATGLYSVEYFTRLAGALRPGGIAAQWLPLERIGADSLAAILRSFFAAFPQGALWWGAGNLIALGSDRAIPRPDAAELDRRLAAARLDPLRTQAPRGAELAAGRIAGAAALRDALGPGPLLSDDRPLLEVQGAAWRGGFEGDTGALSKLLLRIAWVAAGDPESAPAARAWLEARAARERGDLPRADALDAAAAAAGLSGPVARSRAAPLVERGYQAFAQGRLQAAEGDFRDALQSDPGQRDARFGLAGVAMYGGDLVGAIAQLRALLERFPADAAAWNELSGALARSGDRAGAREAAEQALDANPFYPEAIANAGLLAAAAGDRPEAERMLARLREVTPSGVSPEQQALADALARR
jgi:predicted membrane-bound spermidine synthase/tetratricopeptide (TPR) repeat protein